MNKIVASVYDSDGPTWSNSYVWPALMDLLAKIPGDRIFEIGAGNGATANLLRKKGYIINGIEPSESGVSIARKNYAIDIKNQSIEDDLSEFEKVPIVISLEVIEHCYSPYRFISAAFTLLEPNGTLILSTPFHGYWKNLALAITGKLDGHFTVLWEGGHIKFFSMRTMKKLLEEGGFVNIRFRKVGRIPLFSKSMIAIAKKPA